MLKRKTQSKVVREIATDEASHPGTEIQAVSQQDTWEWRTPEAKKKKAIRISARYGRQVQNKYRQE